MKIPVHKIIPFSNVDGIGNRMAIFLQGCNYNCVYCHNPETIKMPNKAKSCSDFRYYSIKDLIKEIDKVKAFIRGVTISGGEPLLYESEIISLFREMESMNLTRYIDTNFSKPITKNKELLNSTDGFLIDIKGYNNPDINILNANKVYENLDESDEYKRMYDEIYLNDKIEDLKILLKLNKVKEIRIVLINGIYPIKYLVKTISNLIKEHSDIRFKLIRVHERGSINKIKNYVPSNAQLDDLEKLVREIGVKNFEVTR